MAVVYGDFESMALHYLKVLAVEDGFIPIFFGLTVEESYGVASPDEYREIVETQPAGNIRPIAAMSSDEWVGLMIVRHKDFFREAEDADVEESVQAGDESGGDVAGVDAGTDREREGEDAGGGGDAGEKHKVESESGGAVN